MPGKVLEDIGGQTMLARVVRRVQWAKMLNEVMVATTANRQLPLSYALPVVRYEFDLEQIASEAVEIVKDQLLEPDRTAPVTWVAPKLLPDG